MVPGLASRRVAPEILDDLPAEDPRAAASRRDLARLNVLMAQSGIMARLLGRTLEAPPRRILEIGAGDGGFMLALARRMAGRWPGVELVLLDRQDIVPPERRAAFGRLGWRVRLVADDVFAWTAAAKGERFDAITANLFLHHFADAEIARLFAALAPLAPVFAATEPRRAALPLVASRMLWAIGANDVTRHDAPASVRAGFRGRELTALWPVGPGTLTAERRRGLFTHAFAAVDAGVVTEPFRS